MREQGSGRIINISSIGGKFYEPLGAWYHATKFAVEGFSDSLRLELEPFGIEVVIIEPGPIITEWNTISRDSLVETSRGGRLRGARRARVRATMERGDTGWAGSPPDVVARKIVKAATDRHTRRRATRSASGAGTIVLRPPAAARLGRSTRDRARCTARRWFDRDRRVSGSDGNASRRTGNRHSRLSRHEASEPSSRDDVRAPPPSPAPRSRSSR